MAYTIVQGTKGNSFQDMLWEMLGVSTWAHMFISCNYCDQSIGIKFDNPEEMATMTNEQFINIVREQGWSFMVDEYTICPQCQAQHGNRQSPHQPT